MRGGAPGSPGRPVFPSASVFVGVRMERSEECRSTRKIAFGLRDGRLLRQRIEVIRGDIENLIKFSQRFRETTQGDIGKRVLGEQTKHCAGRAARLR